MGQAAVRPSRGAVLGEVEVGQEALQLMHSREEYSTVIVGMVAVPCSLMRKTREDVARRTRRTRFRGMRNVEIQEQQQPQGEAEDSQDVASGHTHQERRDTAEDQLADVFYSAYHLHLVEAATAEAAAAAVETTTASSPSCSTGESESPHISIEELRKELRDIFKVDNDRVVWIEEEVKAKEPPRIMVHITIHEAKDLKPKTSKDTSHPYCLVRVSGCSETFKTRVLNNTLTPAWESEFSIGIPALSDAKLMVEVWHKPQEAAVEQLTGVRDFQGLSRLVRDAAASLQMKEMRNLLGAVNVPLAEVKDQKVEGWYDLVKIKEEETNQISFRESFRSNKKRGSIRISLRVSTVAQLNLIGPHWFDAFLNKVVQHHLGYLSTYGYFRRGSKRWSKRSSSTNSSTGNGTSINKSSIVVAVSNDDNSRSTSSSGSSFENETVWHLSMPWKGTLSNTSQVVLIHYAATLSLTPPITTLSWWKVSSKFSVTDQSFLGHLLKTLQRYISEKSYSEEEIQEIRSSLRMWTSSQLDRIRNLTFHFPASTKFVSYDQLKGMLSNFYTIEADLQILQPKVFPRDASVTELVSEALTDFAKSWWESSLKNHGGSSPSATQNQQLEAAVSVAGKVFSFLSDVCNFYHDVFFREARISYLKLTYILLTSELAARVRPLLLQIYRVTTKQKYTHTTLASNHGEADQLSLEAGTPVWHLYKKLEIIQKIGENLPDEVQSESGIRGYHHWFFGGVTRWQERLFARARALVAKEVRKDDFEMDSSGISASASGAKSNIMIIKNSWQKLAWPDEIDGDMAKRLLQDFCGLGTLYTKLVIAKLDSRLREESLPESMFLTVQICTGLNNIEYLRQEMESLPELFELTEDDDAEQNFVIAKTSSKMEGSVLIFMDSVIRKIKPTLWKAVVNSCDTGNEAHLLQEILDQDLCVLKQRLRSRNFQHFLLKIWNVLIVIFCNIVESYSTKRNAEYFKNVYKVLERTWYFFTPTDRRGLDPQQAHSVEYQSLQKTLCNLKMPTESLIAKYYKERCEELQRANSLRSAEIIVRVFFMRTGKLVVQVAMVRDIVRPSKKKPNTCVQIKLVPAEFFPNISSQETMIQRESDAPVFDQEFEFPVSPTDHGIKAGHLLLILKTCQLFHSGGVVGETVVPLDELPFVDSSKDSTVSYKVLNMNMPRNGDDYTAIKALKFRTWDKKALSFLQKIPTRT